MFKLIISYFKKDIEYDCVEIYVPENINENKKKELIEENLPYALITDYYMDNEIKTKTILIQLTKSLFLLETGIKGYDTYDSGVFVAYDQEHALELALKKSNDFKNAKVIYIGEAVEELNIGDLCLSFNAG